MPASSGALVIRTWRSTWMQVPVAWLLEIIDFISFVIFLKHFCLVYLMWLFRCSRDRESGTNLMAEAFCTRRICCANGQCHSAQFAKAAWLNAKVLAIETCVPSIHWHLIYKCKVFKAQDCVGPSPYAAAASFAGLVCWACRRGDVPDRLWEGPGLRVPLRWVCRPPLLVGPTPRGAGAIQRPDL